MRKALLAFFALGLFGVFALELYGQITPKADTRQRRQGKRIRHGIKNKSLTGKETVRLTKQQVGIRKYERKAKSDGDVTKKERVRLQHKQNKSSRSIYRAKHNNRSRN